MWEAEGRARKVEAKDRERGSRGVENERETQLKIPAELFSLSEFFFRRKIFPQRKLEPLSDGKYLPWIFSLFRCNIFSAGNMWTLSAVRSSVSLPAPCICRAEKNIHYPA